MRTSTKSVALSALAGLALAAGLAACGNPPAPADLSGEWVWSGEGVYFDLSLSQDKDSLKGYHVGGLEDGSRIDAALSGEEPSLVAIVKGSEAQGTIASAYSESVSAISLSLDGEGRLHFKVTKAGEGESYIPAEAILVRATAKPDQTGADFQRNSDVRAESIELRIAELSPEEREIPGASEGGMLLLWREGSSLFKCQASYFGDMGRQVDDYYFDEQSQVFLVERNSQLYDNGDRQKILSESKERFYVDGDDLVLWFNAEGQSLPSLGVEGKAELERIKGDLAGFGLL